MWTVGESPAWGRRRPRLPWPRCPWGDASRRSDASTVQAPGATGTDHRLHLYYLNGIAVLEFVEVLVTDVHSGVTFEHFTLGPGDVAVADRGEAGLPMPQCGGPAGA